VIPLRDIRATLSKSARERLAAAGFDSPLALTHRAVKSVQLAGDRLPHDLRSPAAPGASRADTTADSDHIAPNAPVVSTRQAHSRRWNGHQRRGRFPCCFKDPFTDVLKDSFKYSMLPRTVCARPTAPIASQIARASA